MPSICRSRLAGFPRKSHRQAADVREASKANQCQVPADQQHGEQPPCRPGLCTSQAKQAELSTGASSLPTRETQTHPRSLWQTRISRWRGSSKTPGLAPAISSTAPMSDFPATCELMARFKSRPQNPHWRVPFARTVHRPLAPSAQGECYPQHSVAGMVACRYLYFKTRLTGLSQFSAFCVHVVVHAARSTKISQ